MGQWPMNILKRGSQNLRRVSSFFEEHITWDVAILKLIYLWLTIQVNPDIPALSFK